MAPTGFSAPKSVNLNPSSNPAHNTTFRRNLVLSFSHPEPFPAVKPPPEKARADGVGYTSWQQKMILESSSRRTPSGGCSLRKHPSLRTATATMERMLETRQLKWKTVGSAHHGRRQFGKTAAALRRRRQFFVAGIVRAHRLDEVLAHFPDGAGKFAEIGNDFAERLDEPVDLL